MADFLFLGVALLQQLQLKLKFIRQQCRAFGFIFAPLCSTKDTASIPNSKIPTK